MNKSLFLILFCLISASLFAQNKSTFNLFFASDSYEISAAEKLKLDTLVKTLDKTQKANISITTFCDDKGDTKYNQVLANNRAMEVKNALGSMINNTNVTVKASGKGELQISQQSNLDPEQQRQFNRRAEIMVAYEKMPEKKMSDELKAGDKVKLQNILFVGGRSVLFPDALPTLDSLVQILQNNKSLEITILGHVCCAPRGQDGEDHATGLMNLSVVRAKTVYDYLVMKGVAAQRLAYKGMKSDFPLGKGDQADRRVEIEVRKAGK